MEGDSREGEVILDFLGKLYFVLLYRNFERKRKVIYIILVSI